MISKIMVTMEGFYQQESLMEIDPSPSRRLSGLSLSVKQSPQAIWIHQCHWNIWPPKIMGSPLEMGMSLFSGCMYYPTLAGSWWSSSVGFGNYALPMPWGFVHLQWGSPPWSWGSMWAHKLQYMATGLNYSHAC